ncbi:MAG: catechol 2,3-dioxygenase-like lactoylglutathione lyase family enzyme [Bradymonadia bacterium]
MQTSILINVADVEASSAWYQQLFGCTSGHGGPDFEMLMFGDALQLMLHRADADHAHDNPGPTVPFGGGVVIFVRVAGIEAVVEKATKLGIAHGGIVHNPLAHQDEVALQDPDGYLLTVCGPADWA